MGGGRLGGGGEGGVDLCLTRVETVETVGTASGGKLTQLHLNSSVQMSPRSGKLNQPINKSRAPVGSLQESQRISKNLKESQSLSKNFKESQRIL